MIKIREEMKKEKTGRKIKTGALTQLLSGYVGETIWDMVPKLLKKADYDPELAKRGIVFLDNMDRVGLNSDCGDIPEDSDCGDMPEGVKETLAEIFQVRSAIALICKSQWKYFPAINK